MRQPTKPTQKRDSDITTSWDWEQQVEALIPKFLTVCKQYIENLAPDEEQGSERDNFYSFAEILFSWQRILGLTDIEPRQLAMELAIMIFDTRASGKSSRESKQDLNLIEGLLKKGGQYDANCLKYLQEKKSLKHLKPLLQQHEGNATDKDMTDIFQQPHVNEAIAHIKKENPFITAVITGNHQYLFSNKNKLPQDTKRLSLFARCLKHWQVAIDLRVYGMDRILSNSKHINALYLQDRGVINYIFEHWAALVPEFTNSHRDLLGKASEEQVAAKIALSIGLLLSKEVSQVFVSSVDHLAKLWEQFDKEINSILLALPPGLERVESLKQAVIPIRNELFVHVKGKGLVQSRPADTIVLTEEDIAAILPPISPKREEYVPIGSDSEPQGLHPDIAGLVPPDLGELYGGDLRASEPLSAPIVQREPLPPVARQRPKKVIVRTLTKDMQQEVVKRRRDVIKAEMATLLSKWRDENKNNHEGLSLKSLITAAKKLDLDKQTEQQKLALAIGSVLAQGRELNILVKDYAVGHRDFCSLADIVSELIDDWRLQFRAAKLRLDQPSPFPLPIEIDLDRPFRQYCIRHYTLQQQEEASKAANTSRQTSVLKR